MIIEVGVWGETTLTDHRPGLLHIDTFVGDIQRILKEVVAMCQRPRRHSEQKQHAPGEELRRADRHTEALICRAVGTTWVGRHESQPSTAFNTNHLLCPQSSNWIVLLRSIH